MINPLLVTGVLSYHTSKPVYMADKFKPQDNKLDPVITLINKARVSADDVEVAIKDWKEEPPLVGFKTIITPDIE